MRMTLLFYVQVAEEKLDNVNNFPKQWRIKPMKQNLRTSTLQIKKLASTSNSEFSNLETLRSIWIWP